MIFTILKNLIYFVFVITGTLLHSIFLILLFALYEYIKSLYNNYYTSDLNQKDITQYLVICNKCFDAGYINKKDLDFFSHIGSDEICKKRLYYLEIKVREKTSFAEISNRYEFVATMNNLCNFIDQIIKNNYYSSTSVEENI